MLCEFMNLVKTSIFQASDSRLEGVNDLGRTCERLETKLQANLRTLKLNEGLMSCTNSILEYDAAKSRANKLVEVLKAKILWSQTFNELQMIEKTDRKEKFTSLVTLQQCYDILSEVGARILSQIFYIFHFFSTLLMKNEQLHSKKLKMNFCPGMVQPRYSQSKIKISINSVNSKNVIEL